MSLDGVAKSIQKAHNVFDLAEGFEEGTRRVCFGDKNHEGAFLLEFSRASELRMTNSPFPMCEDHLVTFVI